MKTPTAAQMQAMRERLEVRGSSLWWKVQPKYGRVDLTKPAGRINSHGYHQVGMRVNGIQNLWLAHRIVYYLHHGTWPNMQLDHRDRNRLNSTPDNLRLATQSLNMANRTPTKTKPETGHRGVRRNKKGFQASLRYEKTEYIKHFPTLQEAIDYRKHLEKTYRPDVDYSNN
jgi:hypothetical protein